MDLLTPTLSFMRAIHVAALQPLALGFSALGSEPFYLMLLPLVYWIWNRRIGARLGIILLLSVMVNDLFKLAFHLPRPFWIDPLLTPAAGLEFSFGFPSGHSQAAFMVWPYLALRATRKKLFLSLAFALAACIALSRMVLGVHWPLDVVGGALIGLGILWFYEHYGADIERGFRGRSLVLQTTLAAAFVLLCGGIGAFLIARDTQILDAGALGLHEVSASIVARCAALLGLVLGLMFAPVNLPAGGNARQIALRLVVGLIGVAFFYIALKKITPEGEVFRFIRYFCTTFWVAGASLWVFRSLGLNGTKAPLPVVHPEGAL